MNKDRRDKLNRAAALLATAESLVSNALLQEQCALGNMPENLECSDRYSKMEDAVDYLTDAVDDVNNAIDKINNAAA